MAEEADTAALAAEQEALRLKSKAESKYKSSNYKSALKYITRAHRLHPNLPGAAAMSAAFDILHTFHDAAPNPNHYNILGVEPFTPTSALRTKYKKLAFLLHPDKNPLPGADEAFNLVVEAFKFLSDKAKRKVFDTKLRVEMMKEKESEEGLGLGFGEGEVFWTACGTCRVLHQFERRYLGQRLVCPGCNKSFEAVEVDENGENLSGAVKSSQRLRSRGGERKVRKRTSSVGEVMERSEKVKKKEGVDEGMMTLAEMQMEIKRKAREEKSKKEKDSGAVAEKCKDPEVGKRAVARKSKNSEAETGDIVKKGEEGAIAEKCKDVEVEKGGVAKKGKNVEIEESVAAEKTKNSETEISGVAKEAEDLGGDKRKRSMRVESEVLESTTKDLRSSKSRKSKRVESEDLESTDKDLGNSKSKKSKRVESEDLESTAKDLESSKSRKSKRAESENESKKVGNLRRKNRKSKLAESEDLEATEEEESEDVVRFNDFSKGKRSFEKGQVWTTYDEGDGMPRNYGLIDEVVSYSPFRLKISWLDIQKNEDQWLVSWEKMGLCVPCGRFKANKQITVDSVHIFSHVVNCNRVARHIYQIYPKKGSVWAMYSEAAFESEGSNLVVKEKLCYDVVVFLTSYSEMHGLSMGYLEKVDGFNTVFKRREIGAHAIRCLEKDDLRFMSHEISAKKLKGDEASNLPKDCWELDPASLPLDLLTFG